jgi:CheY-like chemotaxis protein
MKKFDKLLLVEDDPISRYATVMVLNDTGIAGELLFVNDGLEAIEYLHEHRTRTSSAQGSLLIILDLNMPIYDGFDVLRYLKMNRVIDLEKVEIMILTSSVSETDKVTAFKYKVSAYIEKPLSKAKLKAVGLVESD